MQVIAAASILLSGACDGMPVSPEAASDGGRQTAVSSAGAERWWKSTCGTSTASF